MNAPRCAVVIPAHNCLSYLREALASVAMQDVPDFEVIVVDDGSCDGTAEWLAQAAAADARIRWLRTAGLGPAGARNLAISQTLAPFIAFLDADDIWWPRKLGRQIAFHERHPQVGFSFTDYLHVGPDGGLHGTCFDYWKPLYVAGRSREFFVVPDAELELLAANVAGTSTIVARRNALQNANGFADCNKSAEDWELWLRLAAARPVACSTAVSATYLMRSGSETQNKRARIEAMENIVGRYAECTDSVARNAVRCARARISVARAELARSETRHMAAAAHHGRAFLARPNLRSARAAFSDLVRGIVPPRRCQTVSR